MIELRTKRRGTHIHDYRLVIDEMEVPEHAAYVFGAGSDKVSATVDDPEIVKRLCTHRLREIPDQLNRLTIHFEKTSHIDLRVRPQFLRSDNNGAFTVAFSIAFRVPFWKRPWSMGELRDAVRKLATDSEDREFTTNPARSPMMLPNFSIDAACSLDQEMTIGEILEVWTPRMHRLIHEAETQLAARARKDALVALFDFPPAVKVPCEQYLLFFAEFLKDLGLDADADITHDAGRVLFSITPKSGTEALELIREALDAYLEFPIADDLGDLSKLADHPRVQQLVANIQHLKSQILLQNAALQYKDATIGQLLVARSPAKGISKEVMQTSLQLIASSTAPTDEEELVEGVLTLKKYEGKGFSLNLPELYRRFQRQFAKITGD